MGMHALRWTDLRERLAVYETLSLPSRDLLRSLNAARSCAGEPFGPDLKPLREHGYLRPTADGAKVRITDEARACHAMLRAAERCPVLAGCGRGELRGWIQAEFSRSVRAELLGTHDTYGDHAGVLADRATDVDWVQRLLDPSHADRLKQIHAREYSTLDHILTPRVRDGLEHLVTVLVDQPTIRVLDLADILKGARTLEIDRTLQAALRYLVVFPAIDAETGALVLGLHPAVRARLARVPATAPDTLDVEIDPIPSVVVPDLQQVLVEVGGGHVRITATGAVFKKDRERMAASLTRLPGSTEDDPEEGLGRVEDATAIAMSLGLIDVGPDADGRKRLVATDRGRTWIAMPATERLRWFLEHASLRARLPADASPGSLSGLWDDPIWSDALLPLTLGLPFDTPWLLLGEAAIEHLATLPTEGAVSMESFLQYAGESCNPLLGQGPRGQAFEEPLRHASATTSELEKTWRIALSRTIQYHLAPLGGVRAGLGPADEPLIGLTPLGAWILGATDTFPEPEPERATVIVQPTFDVVLLEPNPDAERELAAFCDRTGESIGVVFRITKASIVRGAAAGIPVTTMVEALERFGRTPTPPNVRTEIETWHGRQRVLTLRRPWLLDCGDAETASRVLAAAPRRLERLSETIVMVRGTTRPETIAKALAEHGITLDTSQVPKPRKKAARRRPRRRRYW